jgi:diguanylate cyclase (GGDEF)-like protein/PAS domain S-box-containing protein
MDEKDLLICQLSEALLEKEKIVARFKGLLNSIPDPVFMKDENLLWMYGNPTILNLYNIDPNNYVGKAEDELLPEEFAKSCMQSDENTKNSKVINKSQECSRDSDGKLHYYEVFKVPFYEENIFKGLIGVGRDITKTIEQQETLDRIANTDTLTGYSNRYKLTQDIHKSVNPALAILDIDSFSQINDFYGHEVGDDLIKKVADEIVKILSDISFELYHLQGDEYVIFHQNIEKEKFTQKIQTLLSEIQKKHFQIKDELLSLNFSTALSFELKERILQTADMALKIAKQKNKELIIYSDFISLDRVYENNLKWTKKIKQALGEDRIVPFYQPIINNKTLQCEKYECLVRLLDEDEFISPDLFLDISKKTKHYEKITRTMVQKSFEKFKNKSIEFSINLTIEDILNNETKSYILHMLEKYKIGSFVVFEVVESESIQNFSEVLEFLTTLKSYGCKIAIDDFGTGYSNFEHLLKLKPDYLKIDGSMIKNIDKDIDTKMMVLTIAEFAKRMGIQTIAEFVENDAILKIVKELGIDYSQGYHFSKPKPEL